MIKLTLPDESQVLRPRITVFGVGGAGGNAVNNMILSGLEGVDFIVANTDAQALAANKCERRVQLGSTVTRGLGAGAKPEVGRAAAEEQMDEIAGLLKDTHMVFITAGMGGGTGTGAAPVVARLAREAGILTVGVVTKPFQFEGTHRMRLAESGIAEMSDYVDTLIVIPNQNLFRVANERTSFSDAFRMADAVLFDGVRSVTDLIVRPGHVNLDFADIRSVMTEMGKAMMGTGESTGERRAMQAAEAAINNPLLDYVSLKGARALLVNVTHGEDLALYEVEEAVNHIREQVDPDVNLIFGSSLDLTMGDRVRVSAVATGIVDETMALPVGGNVVPWAAQGRRPAAAATPTAPVAPAAATGGMPSAVAGLSRQDGVKSAAPHQQPAAAYSQAPAAGRQVPVPGSAAALRRPSGQPPQQGYGQAPQGFVPAAPQPLPLRQPEIEPLDLTDPMQDAGHDGSAHAEHFFAPPPVDPGPRVPITADQPERRQVQRRPTLFERMTGMGAAAKRFVDAPSIDEPAAPQQPPQQAAPGQQQPAQPQMRVPEPQRPQQPQRPAMPEAEAERPRLTQAEEDLLDIPAFLRRQAN